MDRLARPSQLLLAMAVVLTVMGVAGFALRSFAYPLVFLLAALFGVVGAASLFARSAGQLRLLFWVVVAVAFVASYLYIVSGGGGPPPPSPTR